MIDRLNKAKSAQAKAAQAEADAATAKEAANKAVTVKSGDASAKQQAYEAAQANADSKKTAAAEAEQKAKQGAAAYFKDKLGKDSDAYKILTSDEANKYRSATKVGSEGDATTLDNMVEALDQLASVNAYRAKESKEAGYTIPALGVSDTLMAIAMNNANYWGWQVDATHDGDHTLQYDTAENLCGESTDGDWGFGEKEAWIAAGKPTGQFSKYGHYFNVVNPNYTLAGIGVNSNYGAEAQEFTQNSSVYNNDTGKTLSLGRVMSLDEYIKDVQAYQKTLANAPTAYKQARRSMKPSRRLMRSRRHSMRPRRRRPRPTVSSPPPKPLTMRR